MKAVRLRLTARMGNVLSDEKKQQVCMHCTSAVLDGARG